MAENVPPGSATKAAITSEQTARGLPYYERLRRDLRDTLQKKRILDKNIVSCRETANCCGKILTSFTVIPRRIDLPTRKRIP